MTTSAVAIRHHYAGPEGYDFRLTAANVNLQNGNLSEGLGYGSRILQGRGNTLDDTFDDSEIGAVAAYRMPGYGMFVALAGAVFRVSPLDAVGLAQATAWLQTVSFTATVAVLAAALPLCMSNSAAAVLTAAMCWFPQSFDATQGDTIVPYCGFLIAASFCMYLRQRAATSKPPLRYDLLVHAAFGLFLLVRSDVLAGWVAVSLIMYRRSWRRLAIPAAFVVAITGTFGLYKMAYGGQFVPTTTNVGHVAFVGLWQVPQHQFVWNPSDESYAEWIVSNGHRYMSASANRFATREVLRFWMTFPGYAVSLIWHKLNFYIGWPSWGGTLPSEFSWSPALLARAACRWPLLLIVATSLAAEVQVRRTLLLGWPMFFNLPIFFLLQGGGERFFALGSCSIALVGVPLALDPDYYRTVFAKRRFTVPVAVTVLLLWRFGTSMDEWMLRTPEFRYATPFLDPANSTLNVLRTEPRP